MIRRFDDPTTATYSLSLQGFPRPIGRLQRLQPSCGTAGPLENLSFRVDIPDLLPGIGFGEKAIEIAKKFWKWHWLCINGSTQTEPTIPPTLLLERLDRLQIGFRPCRPLGSALGAALFHRRDG